MRILEIAVDRTVIEREEHLEDWMAKDVEWDAVDIGGGHDAWVNDEAMFLDNTTFCTVNGRRLPLPAYVAAADGERTVSATMTVEELEAIIG